MITNIITFLIKRNSVTDNFYLFMASCLYTSSTLILYKFTIQDLLA